MYSNEPRKVCETIVFFADLSRELSMMDSVD